MPGGTGASGTAGELLRETRERLERSLSLLEAALDSTADGLLIVDAEGRIVRYNRRFVDIWQIPEEVLASGTDARAIGHVLDRLEDPEAFRSRIEALYADPTRTSYDVLRFRDGRVVERYSRPQRLGDEIVGRVWSFRDVTEQKRMQEALLSSERRYRRLFEESRHALYITTRDGDFVDVNRSMLELFGVTRQELLRLNARDMYADGESRSAFQREMAARGSVRNYEEVLRDSQGRRLDCLITATARRDASGAVIGYEGIIEDITERKEAEARLLYDAFHDRLTGLPNRGLFMDRLAQLIRRGRREGSPGFSVLFLDADRFKVVNDSLGHVVGDRLLKEVGRRLETCLRPGDTVARVGGDEFALLLDGVSEEAAARAVAERIHAAMECPLQVGDREVYATVSIGIAVGTPEYVSGEDILRDADIAMYRAKKAGRARIAVFDRPMHAQAVAVLELETELRRAVERDQFALHYQPIVCLSSGSLTGFESLLRWNHPRRGELVPADFMAIAEETGLIVPIGLWTIEEAARRARAWREADPRSLYVAVNLSATQLSQPGLVEEVAAILDRTGTPPEALRLELTENVLLAHGEASLRTMARLRDLGIRLMIDDFGTGYSSLSYLHRFAADTLKIDGSFINGIGPNGENSELVRTIVALADELEMEVVAEGVETADQFRMVRILGCTSAQGYHLARPAPAADVEDALRRTWELG